MAIVINDRLIAARGQNNVKETRTLGDEDVGNILHHASRKLEKIWPIRTRTFFNTSFAHSSQDNSKLSAVSTDL